MVPKVSCRHAEAIRHPRKGSGAVTLGLVLGVGFHHSTPVMQHKLRMSRPLLQVTLKTYHQVLPSYFRLEL